MPITLDIEDLWWGEEPIIRLYYDEALIYERQYPVGNESHGSLLEFCRYLAGYGDTSGPVAGGTLTINSQALGSVDVCIKYGDQTVSSFTAGDWFTTTPDSRSAVIVVIGNLTIDAAVLFRPTVRKLFTALYVTGNLVVNGEISMSQRGANHSASGSNITAQNVRLATGTFDGVVNPQVPAIGATGGVAQQATGTNGVNDGANGTNGTDGQTGGGASGAAFNNTAGGQSNSGAGAAGSAFSGGPAGGGAQAVTNSSNITAGSGNASGGAGGAANADGAGVGAGGAGNPGGAGDNGGQAGDNGTGGVLCIFVEGDYSGSGEVTAEGADGGDSITNGGGGSGGGSINIFCGSDSSGPAPNAAGGIGGVGTGGAGRQGGNGGRGTERILPITPD